MTYESLDQSTFVAAAYVVGVGGTLAMIAWSWISMRRSEERRERVKRG